MTNMIYRPVTKDDLDTAYELYCFEHIESYGDCGVTKEDQLSEWDYPNFDLSEHTMYAFTENDTNIAYAELRYYRELPVRPLLFGYVHPDYRGQGIGTYLTEWGIEAAKQFIPQVPDDARVVLGTFTNMEDGQGLFQNFGFDNIRQSWVMGMDIREDMPEPEFPEGFYTLTMDEHPVLEDFVRVYHEAFRDHRGSMNESLEAAIQRWQAFINDDMPPENFVLLKEGDQDAAVLIMCNKSDENPNQLYIQTLGTLPAYRRRGFGTQLLYYAHEHARKLGKKRIGLSVDGASLTGANRLYEKVGFGVDMVYHAYELELRSGIELTNQG